MATKTPSIPAITVSSRSPMGSFRRAGREWARESVTVPVSDFKPAELQALRDEPMLVVSDTTITPEPAEAAE